jgi:hypothetical protein
MTRALSRRQFGLAGAALALPAAVRAQPRRGLSVVELFTSQLCPGCPAADAFLIDLARREELIALAFHVTHYDRGSFKDAFGREEFNRCQFSYAQAFHRDTAFTPEIVVNGHADAPGLATGFVEELLVGAELDGPAITPGNGAVEVAGGPRPPLPADVWVAHYDPRLVSTPVRGIEDRRLQHINVVHGLYLLGDWTGNGQRYEAPPVPQGLRRAVGGPERQHRAHPGGGARVDPSSSHAAARRGPLLLPQG